MDILEKVKNQYNAIKKQEYALLWDKVSVEAKIQVLQDIKYELKDIINESEEDNGRN